MLRLKIKQIYTNLIILLLGVSLYYYSYRYIFQYNSSDTSPTYSNTPMSFQIGKYIICGAIIILYLLILNNKKKKIFNQHSLSMFVKLFLYTFFLLLYGIININIISIQRAMIYFIPLILGFWGFVTIDVYKIEKFIYYFCIYSIIYESIQVILFILYGRLPALAYAESFSVRFGGPWDDPNGFSIFISFLLPFTYYYCTNKNAKIFWIITNTLMILLAQSVTAIIANTMALSIYYIANSNNKTTRQKKAIKLFCLILFIIPIAFILSNISLIHTFLEMKQGSVDGHMNSFESLSQISIIQFLFGFSHITGESDITNHIGQWGIFFLLLFYTIYLQNIYKLYHLMKQQVTALWKSCFIFQLTFLFASINLPVSTIFPISLTSCIIILISSFQQENKTKYNVTNK